MFSRKSIVVLLAVVLIGSVGAFALRSKAKNARPTITQDAGVTIHNNTPGDRWANVPIQISSVGGSVYQVENRSGFTIKTFALHLYAAHRGMPLHGPGSHRHHYLFHWGEDTDGTLNPGESTRVDIGDVLRVFATTPDTDMGQVEIWPDSATFDDPLRRWRAGRWLEQVNGLWRDDPNLNVKPASKPAIIGNECYVYNENVNWASFACAGECPNCKYKSPAFLRSDGGYKLSLQCEYCFMRREDGSCCLDVVCQKSNGSACTSQILVADLDYANPC